MGSSLEKLVENLYDNEDKHKNFHSMKQYYNDHMDLLCKKGIYPYEWIDNIDKLPFLLLQRGTECTDPYSPTTIGAHSHY